MKHMYRIVILILTTICLSLMMANMLTLNFCVICMTEEIFDMKTIEFNLAEVYQDSVVEDVHLHRQIAQKLRAANLHSQLNISLSVPQKLKIDEEGSKEIEIMEINPNGAVKARYKNVLYPADFVYSSSERSILFSSVAIGALLAISPISICIHRFGTRHTFLVVMLISSASTFAFPFLANIGVSALIICRIFQGFGYAACMPVIGSVTSTWARLDENGLFSAALTSFIQLGPVITMPIAGFLCASSLRWPAVFYVHAAITITAASFWWYIYENSPIGHRFVTNAELSDICKGKSMAVGRCSLPWIDICKTPATWAVWIAAIGNMFSVQMVIVFAPIYMNKALHISVVKVGLAAALPTLLQFAVKMLAGCVSDRLLYLTETVKVRLFNSIAFIGMSALFVALSQLQSAHPYISLSMFVASTAVLGFNTGGFFKSAVLIGQHFSYFINAGIQVIMCFAMLLMPLIVFNLTPNESAEEWPRVFLLCAVILTSTNIFFCVYGSGEAAKFTHFTSVDTQVKEPPSAD